jgi:hypothetical protein
MIVSKNLLVLSSSLLSFVRSLSFLEFLFLNEEKKEKEKTTTLKKMVSFRYNNKILVLLDRLLVAFQFSISTYMEGVLNCHFFFFLIYKI